MILLDILKSLRYLLNEMKLTQQFRIIGLAASEFNLT